jgi:hypothetical protein
MEKTNNARSTNIKYLRWAGQRGQYTIIREGEYFSVILDKNV